MPAQTDLSVAPYFNDFDASKNYVSILFKPGVALQTREINQLQTILQNQIEKFGDAVFSKGTIINGCNFQYYPFYPYAKLKDLQVNGLEVLVDNYVGLFAKNSSNLVSYIVDSSSGYQTLAPDLNTLYLRYINSGDSTTANAYADDDVLTIYDANNSIFSVTVPVGGTGSGLSNTDSIVFMSAITLTDGTTANVGDTINDPVSLANAVVVSINTTAISGSSIYSVRPYANSLNNPSVNSSSWSFNTGNSVFINNTTSTNIVSILGFGAYASPVTDGSGKIKDVLVTAQGDDYVYPPYVTVKTSNNSANVSPTSINLTAQNYLAQVTVANSSISGNSDATGSGYAFGVSEGYVYQKGFFLYVKPQTLVVSKYSDSPDEISVGFETSESIINSNIDASLLDNSTGAGVYNFQAPGADRLQLIPGLKAISSSDAVGNTDFFELTAFSLGQPYLQNQLTSYSAIGKEMARRTKDASGDFVLDQFQLSTATSTNTAAESTSFRVVIDPGNAYISGERVTTKTNYFLELDQGIDTGEAPSTSINLNYGNYIKVKNLGGIFDFTLGDLVTFYDTAAEFLDSFTGSLAASGNAIGTARLRAKELVSGTPGSVEATYNLYVFDITMNAGKNFRDIKSVYYDSSTGSGYEGIADIATEVDPITNQNIAILYESDQSTLLFNDGSNSTKSANAIIYQYNTIKTGNTAGSVQVTLTGTETFPFTAGANLNSSQLNQLTLIPVANATLSANLSGTFEVTASSNVVSTNSGADSFNGSVTAGEYLKIYSTGAGAGEVKRIDAIINSTALRVDSNIINSNASTNIVKFHPEQVSIPLNGISGRYANVSSSGQLLTITLGETFSANTNYVLETPIKKTGATPNPKTTHRGSFVKINLSNNDGNTVGPWNLGIPDVFRMRAVYTGSNTDVIAANSTSFTTSTDVTNEFYIDHNQNFDYYDHSWLYLKPNSSLTLNSNSGLLVEFDHFTNANPGFFTIDSYSQNNDTQFANLVSTANGGSINITEIPELSSSGGLTIDLCDQVDFRMVVANTAVVTNNVAAATINPEQLSANNRFGNNASLSAPGFPIPDSVYTSDITYYMGRVDRIIVDTDSHIRAIRGKPGLNNFVAPAAPDGSMTINILYIPPYPSITQQMSDNAITILDKGIANELYSVQKVAAHAIVVPVLNENDVNQYQPKGYTMADIAGLENRIAALEYYVALSKLEDTMSSLTIPSSLDGTINRFKYGFFADSFKNSDYTDTQNPEYAASFVNNEVVAKQKYINFEFGFNTANTSTANGVVGSYLMLPYESKTLINQDIATDGAVYIAPPVVNNVSSTYTPKGTLISSYCSGYDRYNTLADGAGGTYDALVETNSPTCGWTPPPPPPPSNYYGSLSSNPSTFTLISSTNSIDYITYYANGRSTTVTSDYFVSSGLKAWVVGRDKVPHYHDAGTVTTYYFAADQAFTFTATGLKPNSTHTFTFNNSNMGSSCKPYGGSLGGALVTDASGSLTFTFYYNSGLQYSSTSAAVAQALVNNLAGSKVATLSTSGSSASFTITFLKGASF